MDAEQLSRIWSSFFQTPYSLSFVYQATAVLIQGKKSGKAALPVRSRQVSISPLRPIVTQVEVEKEADRVIFADSTVLIRGRDFRGDSLRVHLGDAVLTPDFMAETEIRVRFSPELPGLRAGVQSVQVHTNTALTSEHNNSRASDVRSPMVSHSASNAFPIVICPRIVGESRLSSREERDRQGLKTEIGAIVSVDTVVSPEQRVFLLLNQIDNSENPMNFIFKAERRESDTRELYFLLHKVLPGTYLFRVQIDGAESPLTVDRQGRYAAPRLTI